MLIQDPIYGDYKVNELVLLQLIESAAFQRLKRVNQYGGVNFVFPGRYQTSRYEHSLGVWHILESLGCDLEVQVAGLLHDIGHAAFSHMVDQAMSSKEEDYHEKHIHLISGIEEIAEILQKHGFALKDVKEYAEIKQSLPDINADRLDYALRDYFAATGVQDNLPQEVLESVVLVDGVINFNNADVAKKIALRMLEAMWLVIYEPNVAVVYQALTEMIRMGVEKGWIAESDLFLDDESLFAIMKSVGPQMPAKYMDIFTHKFEVVAGSENDYDFRHVKMKSRVIDPLVIVAGASRRLSEIDSEFAKTMAEKQAVFEERKAGAYFKVKFEQ